MQTHLTIAISGIDFTGKSTLAGRLANDIDAKLFIFPSKETKAGKEARSSLMDKDMKFEEREELFLKDAFVNGELIRDLKKSVVTDRSPLCQMAYRYALSMDPTPYMRDVEKVGGFLPDVSILLTVNEETLKDRMMSREGELDVVESVSIDHMLKRQEGYEKVFHMFKIHHIIIHTDNKSPQQILDEVKVKLKLFLEIIRDNETFKMKENEFYTG